MKIKRQSCPEFRREEKARNLERWYGITIEQYEAMHAEQGGLCAICGKPETARTGATNALASLAVDHDSVSGEIRELLCSRCNRGIGLLQHNPDVLAAGAAYLRRHHPKLEVA